mmetsp:Transcript_50774/g.107733  ORF Transcript_50774/g.107733 Transcript_50774/m.107733 type:complete len:208 (+) Transcript_50774:2664-3287(+)
MRFAVTSSPMASSAACRLLQTVLMISSAASTFAVILFKSTLFICPTSTSCSFFNVAFFARSWCPFTSSHLPANCSICEYAELMASVEETRAALTDLTPSTSLATACCSTSATRPSSCARLAMVCNPVFMRHFRATIIAQRLRMIAFDSRRMFKTPLRRKMRVWPNLYMTGVASSLPIKSSMSPLHCARESPSTPGGRRAPNSKQNSS